LKENLAKVKHFFDEENVERKLFFDNNDSYVEYIGDVFEFGNRQQSRDRDRLGPEEFGRVFRRNSELCGRNFFR
jgi:hypothetical protein